MHNYSSFRVILSYKMESSQLFCMMSQLYQSSSAEYKIQTDGSLSLTPKDICRN